jgi:hypothetical protein
MLLNTFEVKGGEIRASIRRQELILQRLQRYGERLVNTKSYVGVCDLRQNAEFVYYINRHNAEYDNRADMQEISRRWLKYMPFTRRYFEIPEEDLTRGGDDYAWGFSLGAQYVAEFGIETKPPVRAMASRLCIHSAFKSAGKDKFSARHLDFMVAYARENGYSPVGGAFGNLACSVMEEGKQTGYFEVWLPVEGESE